MSAALVETTAYAHTFSGGDRYAPLRNLLGEYVGKEMVDLEVPDFLWPILSPLEIGFTGALGRELGPGAFHRRFGWDESYAWVIDAANEIYVVWYGIEEEFGLGAMLNLDDPEIADAITSPSGAEFIGLERIENAHKLRRAKGFDWYRRALDFRLDDL